MTPTLPTEAPEESVVGVDYGTPSDDFGVNFRKLPKQLQETLAELTKEAQGQERAGRRIEMLEDYQNRQYLQNNQFIYLRGADDWCFTQAFPGATYSVDGQDGSFGNFLEVYNIITPYATIQSAKLTENTPGIDFQPEDPAKSEDISSSNAAEGMRHDFDRQNDIKQLQKDFVYHLQCGGRVVMWNKTEMDESLGRRIGTSEVFGTVECKVPLYANCRKDFWYVIAYKDPDIKLAKSRYKWISEKLQAGETCLNEGQYERMTRLGLVRSSSGGNVRAAESIGHLITEGYIWFRPSAWCDKKDIYNGPNGQETVQGDDGEERTKQIRDKLDELFPKGVRVCFVGKQYAESFPESMDEALIVAHAYLGKGQNRLPILTMVISSQDEVNTLINNAAETRAFMNDGTAVMAGEEEYAAITKQRSQPGAWIQLKNEEPSADIRSRMMPIKGGTWDSSWQNFLAFLKGDLPQFQMSVPPSIWGESVKGNDTAAGLQLVSAQAMGVLGYFWVVQVAAFAQMYQHNCLMIMADNEYPDTVTVQLGEGETVKIEKQTLMAGRFKVYPDTQSGFPESTASERQVWDQTMTQLAQTPLAPQIYGSPDNIANYLQKRGISEIVIPEAVSRNKQLREIEQLLKESPIVSEPIQVLLDNGTQIPEIIDAIKQQVSMLAQQMQTQQAGAAIAAASGATPPPIQQPDPSQIAKASIRVWPSDFHNYEAAKCRDFLSSEACWREQEAQNTRGILNVMLHMMEHEMEAAKEAPAPMPQMPMRKPPGKAPGAGAAPPMPAPAAPGAPGAVQ